MIVDRVAYGPYFHRDDAVKVRDRLGLGEIVELSLELGGSE